LSFIGWEGGDEALLDLACELSRHCGMAGETSNAAPPPEGGGPEAKQRMYISTPDSPLDGNERGVWDDFTTLMPGLVSGTYVFFACQQERRGWHREVGLARLPYRVSAASRVYPTCGDKPGHDE